MVPSTKSDGRSGFAARLKQAALDAGLPDHGMAAAMARRMGVSEAAVGKWLKARSMPDTKRLDAISAMLGVTVEFLLTGRTASAIPSIADAIGTGSQLVGTKVPVIPFASVAVALADRTASPAMMAVDWKYCPMDVRGPRTFAYRNQNDQNRDPMGPKSYPSGCLVYVDPDATSPPAESMILAQVENGEILMGQHMVQAGRTWLRFLNTNYPPYTGAYKVVGTVIGKWEDA